MEYREEDYLMLSGIQHFAFCRRQWAMIHIEQVWEENLRTAEGSLMHERCHDAYVSECRGEVIISRAMPVFSASMGVSGECDVVEFRKSAQGISLSGREGCYLVYPVEYKRGAPKDADIDILQLTAQAMCLEEMLLCDIEHGAIFYGQTKKRLKVDFTDALRTKVRDMFAEMHELLQRGYVPKVKPTKSCQACSLKNLCMPKLYRLNQVKAYIRDSVVAQEMGEL